MKNQVNESVQSRRDFLRKSVYVAPALVALGSLNVYASSENGNSKGVNITDSKGVAVRANSSLKCNGGSTGNSNSNTNNNDAHTGNSLFGNGNNNGNNMFGGDDKSKGNNGFGNGDQEAPGNSLNNNNAENATGLNNGQSKKNSEED